MKREGKVWICKGEVYGKRDLSPNVGVSTASNNAGPSNKPMSPKRKKK
jgi:small subunit ribosomal protein S3